MRHSGKTVRRKVETSRIPKQGDIYFVDLPRQEIRIDGTLQLGREMCDPHRCLILQAADVTREMAFVIVIPISSAKEKEERASWVEIPSGSVSGIPDRSFLICEQVRCVDKRRLERYVGKLGPVYIILAQKLLDFLCPSMLDQIPDNEILGSQTDTQKK